MAVPNTAATNGALVARAPGGRRTEKIAETVARQILREIKQQGLHPGSMLPPESVMLERFEIGRGSLREALRILEVNGLVTIKTGPGGGPIVAAHDPRNFGQMSTLHLQSLGSTFRQLLEARVDLETMLAGRAAAREGDEAAELLRSALELAEGIPAARDEQYASVASGFHSTVFEAAGNPVLALMANSIQSIWAVRVTSVLFQPNERGRVQQEHQAIAKAIERHDAKKAERLMRAHMDYYREYCELRYPARLDDVVDWS
jgi:GntR family transcriptional repressor for pyruvate dehydrogenase complex